ncbi:MAG: aromatic ring-hydroxylating dioxygenase subunit alpha [Deltaproteobacteria bacterium]|nr:aromatic ring-hydroxylating dioxygenase subunit alpha [Deltaproteobacteria bacterium]
MLTTDENLFITQVSKGTPCGELLRRYWHPVAAAAELTDEKPIKTVKILNEKLVVYRDRSGKYGLVGERCPHRLASLAYGRVDHEGIRCPYHGWKFNGAGKCLEQPAEPADSTFKERIKHVAYPVEYLGGLIYAYLGPAPAPLLPRWDVLVWERGKRWIVKDSLIDCNWLQAMENSVDPAHLFWLHGDTAHLAPRVKKYSEKHEFIRFEYGIKKRRTTLPLATGGKPEVDEHPLLFPSVLRHVARFKGGHRHNLQIRVPVDDTHTQVFRVSFLPTATDHSPADMDVPFRCEQLKTGSREYDMSLVSAQDSMAWETQGPVMDRSQEHLGVADEGIIELRKMLREQIEHVQQGFDPLGVIRDPAKNRLIDLGVINERIGLHAAKAA